MEILIVGDVFSKLGRESFERNVAKIKKERNINFIVVNGENTSHGKGLNQNHFKWYMTQGVNVVTLGNHTYDNKQIFDFIDDTPNLIRPYNFPSDAKGKGVCTINYNGLKITVFQMSGQVFMKDGDKFANPFSATEEILNKYPSDIYICDFHGEATSEKIAYGLHFDGRVHIMYGTHTHVTTTDGRILPNGSAYITDLGMTGALNGVIGTKKEIIIDRFINHSMLTFAPEDSGESQFNAFLVSIDEKTKKVTKVDTISVLEK